MINLLSPNDKRQLKAARQNVILLRYNIVILGTILAIAFVYGAGFFITMRGKVLAEEQLNEDRARTSAYADIQKQSEVYAKNLNTAKVIMANEITYSSIITKIAQDLPSGAVLTNLTINPESFGKPMTISASVKSEAKALELKSALEESSLFKDVSLESVSKDGADEATTGYSTSVVLKATFATEVEVKALKEATP